MNELRCDVAVIGAGPAGYVASIRLAQLRKRVVVIEEARVGGVCLNRGCIPVKALLHAASIVRNAAVAKVLGITFNTPKIDFVSLGSWKGRIVERLSRGIEFLLKENGVKLVRGRAQILSPNRIRVTGEEEIIIAAHDVVIAIGSEPANLPGLMVDHQKIIDSNSALNLTGAPETITIIGAGAVGLEFATIFARLGSKVTVLEVCEQILPGIDREIALLLQKQLEREGIEFRLGVRGIACPKDAGESRAVVCYNDNGEHTMQAERVLVAVGRKPKTAGLGIDEIGIEQTDQGFIKTDAHFQTSVKGVYAIGDVRGGALLAHKAMHEGLQLAAVIANLGPTRGVARAIPMVVYTDPEFAAVGLSAEQAEKQGFKIRVVRVPATAIGRSLTLGRTQGLCKVVAEEKSFRILGVQILSPQADVLIAEAAVAVELGLTAEQLGRVVHPHPTMSELLFEASHAVLGSAIHILNQ
ncbi:MAG: dihydrolipoyl dehydrogenase [bacterium]